jgi:hypothetical protein
MSKLSKVDNYVCIGGDVDLPKNPPLLWFSPEQPEDCEGPLKVAELVIYFEGTSIINGSELTRTFVGGVLTEETEDPLLIEIDNLRLTCSDTADIFTEDYKSRSMVFSIRISEFESGVDRIIDLSVKGSIENDGNGNLTVGSIESTQALICYSSSNKSARADIC